MVPMQLIFHVQKIVIPYHIQSTYTKIPSSFHGIQEDDVICFLLETKLQALKINLNIKQYSLLSSYQQKFLLVSE